MGISKDEKDYLIDQIEKLCGKRPLFYLKFCSCEQFAKDVCSGKLYANTPAYFREQELRSGERGQGDAFELISLIETQRITMCDCETGDVIMIAPKGTLKVQFKDDDVVPMVCFVGIPLGEMEIIEADESHADFLFPFTEEEYILMEEKFGKYCVVISAREIENKIQKYCLSQNCDYVFDAIDYCPQNRIDRIQAFNVSAKERFLYKNEDLAYQREYRLALACEMPKDQFIRIEELNEATILQTSMLRNMKFTIHYTAHEISNSPEG